MEITRKSLVSGTTRTMDLPVEQFQMDAWEKGGLAQVVFANLTAEQREFIMTGTTSEEWDSLFGSEETE